MSDNAEQIAALSRKVEELTQQVSELQDIHQIRMLQHKYGYYMDKCMWEEILDLYSDDAELHFMGGIYRGKAGLRRLYIGRIAQLFTGGEAGPVDGFLSDYMQLQDVIDIASDNKTAQGRFRYFMQGGNHESRDHAIPGLPEQWWESGVYENEYIKENAVWKIRKLGLHLAWRADYRDGWRHARPGVSGEKPVLYPDDPDGPDEYIEGFAATWPKAAVQPFHYPHPVTGHNSG
ncbi:MAG: nuclear transport factor 2 family protein [Gammaproteobacteria bacterium]